jgi:NTP pyrophosphatase (non-canonical NTP hydrolase)
MDIKDILSFQTKFDTAHGFQTNFGSNEEKYTQISKDLVGLLGEVGEFANIVKKITLQIDRSAEVVQLDQYEQCLREELVDSWIYLLRLASILNMDLQDEYLKKMKINEKKYRDFL